MTSASLVERLSGLINSAAAVVGEVDLDHVLRRLVTEARAATGAEYAALGVIGTHGVLSDFIYEGVDADTARRIGALPRGKGVLGTVVREKATIVLEALTEHPDFSGFPKEHPEMDSFLGVPVRVGDSVFGNLYLADKPGGFDRDDVELVEALALIAGSAVSTARLRDRLRALAIVEDRDRIARDLHDSIIQDLFAIGLSLQGLSDRVTEKSVSVVLNTAVDQLHGSVEALRRYIYELRAVDDFRLSLSRQLNDLIERMGNAYPTELNLEIEGDVDSIEPRIGEEILKLITESVSNALRHSEAHRVEITVIRDNSGMQLTIQDDGIGFDFETVVRGMGLLNMRERARRLGGTVKIASEGHTGTRVVIRLPGL